MNLAAFRAGCVARGVNVATGSTLLNRRAELHEFPGDLLDLARGNDVFVLTLRARGRGRVNGKALRTLTIAHSRRGVRLALSRGCAFKRPLADILGKSVAVAISNVVKDDCVRFSGRRAQDSPDLLEVQAERGRGAEQDRGGDHGEVEALAHDLHACHDVEPPIAEIADALPAFQVAKRSI